MLDKYIAFISYSRKDKEVADWLHAKLEDYVLPDREKALSIFPFEGKYFRRVFLDTQDLHVEERPFTTRLQKALENSAFLIVLCSRHSAESPFVDKEIRYFLETHEYNMSRVVPLFIDEVSGSIPPAFAGTSIMERHFPIYNTRLSKTSEANNYCFYQIIAYILKLNFSDVYNRYEVAEEKASRRRRNILLVIITILAVFLGMLGFSYYEYRIATNEALRSKEAALNSQEKLLEFEKKVFPAAVVHGYEDNFLRPVIRHLKGKGEKFKIFILMPHDKEDLTHRNRVGDFEYHAKMNLGIDSIPFLHLPTETKRGSRIMCVSKNGHIVPGVYLDFATTTTSFLNIAEFKKSNEEYRDIPIDTIINGYSHEFVDQTILDLKGDSVFVEFLFDPKQLLDRLRKETQSY